MDESHSKERCKSSQRARIIYHSNRINSEQKHVGLFSKQYPVQSSKDGSKGAVKLVFETPTTSSKVLGLVKTEGKEPDLRTSMTSNIYMMDLISKAGSEAKPVKNKLGDLTGSKHTNRLQNPFATEYSSPGYCGGNLTYTDASMSPMGPRMPEHGDPALKDRGLKIFQKLSESIIAKKNSASLRSSFNRSTAFIEKVKGLKEALEFGGIVTIPELPVGRRLRIKILSNWGHPKM
jgi:hypothetical protein